MRLVLLTLTAFLILRAHDPISTKLTWTQEVSRIVYKRCAGCHREGGNAPMSLLTYAEARPWAKAIKEEVLNRRMPPWGAVKGFGDFRDDPSLTQDEITRIAEWVEGGAPEGEAIYLPFPPKPSVPPAMPRGTVVRGLKGPARLLGIRPLTSIESAQSGGQPARRINRPPAVAERLQSRVEAHLCVSRADPDSKGHPGERLPGIHF